MKTLMAAAALCGAAFVFSHSAMAAPDYARRSDFDTCSDRALNIDLRAQACERLLSAGVGGRGDFAMAFNDLGTTYQARGDFDKAFIEYSNAITVDPAIWQGYVNRAAIYRRRLQYDLALADCTKAIELTTDSSIPYAARAATYRAEGRLDLAMADYGKAIALKDDAAAYFNRGDAYYAMRDYPSAIADFTEALKRNPECASCLLGRSDAYRRQNRKDLADADDHAVLAIGKDAAPEQRASAESQLGLNDAAIADYTTAITLNPDEAAYHLRRGLVYETAGKYDPAMADFTEALRLDPKSSTAAERRGAIFALRKDHANAIAAYSQAIAINPRTSFAFANRGDVERGMGHYDQAMADLNMAVALAPHEAAWLNLRGAIYDATNDYPSAIADYDRAVALKADYLPALNNACWDRAIIGKELDKALEDCTSSVKLKPDPAALDSLGFVQFRLGHMQDALAAYNSALAADPKIPSSLYMRGVIKRRTGDASGDADIAAALAIDPKIAAQFSGYGVTVEGKPQ